LVGGGTSAHGVEAGAHLEHFGNRRTYSPNIIAGAMSGPHKKRKLCFIKSCGEKDGCSHWEVEEERTVKKIVAIICASALLFAGTMLGHFGSNPVAGHGDGGISAGHGDGGISAGHGDGGVSAGHGDGGISAGHGDGGETV
jgi:hypothetical protein